MTQLITSAFPSDINYITINTGASAGKTFKKSNTFLRSVCSQVTDSEIYNVDPDSQFIDWHLSRTESDLSTGNYVLDLYPVSASQVHTLSGAIESSVVNITTPSRQDYTLTFSGSLCGFRFYGQIPVDYDNTLQDYVGSISGCLYTGNHTLTGTNLGTWSTTITGASSESYTELKWHYVDLTSYGINFSAGDVYTISITGFNRNSEENINTAFLYYNLSSTIARTGYNTYGRSELSNNSDYNISLIYSI